MRLITRAPLPRRHRHPRPSQAARRGRPGRSWPRKRTTPMDACHALWAVCVKGWTQTATAHVLRLNQGVVSRIVRRLRFPDAYPIPISGFEGKRRAPRHRTVRGQGELPF